MIERNPGISGLKSVVWGEGTRYLRNPDISELKPVAWDEGTRYLLIPKEEAPNVEDQRSIYYQYDLANDILYEPQIIQLWMKWMHWEPFEGELPKPDIEKGDWEEDKHPRGIGR
ncbi:MAG: hypothetical protein ABFD14_03730 [Anaerolineaceae bacterium]